jgi:hypothetical protein
VKGFGENLSAVAIGCSSVRLEGHYNNKNHPILLNNALHIPAACTNLVSGIQLDKASVTSMLGNNKIFLSINNRILVSGSIVNNMYRLDMTIVPPITIFLASCISTPNLASCIDLTTVSTDFYTA